MSGSKPEPREHFDLDDEFEGFMRKALPDVPEHSIQYKESRRVFMSGVTALYFFVTADLTLLSDEQGEKELKSIGDQLDDFFQRQLGFNR